MVIKSLKWNVLLTVSHIYSILQQINMQFFLEIIISRLLSVSARLSYTLYSLQGHCADQYMSTIVATFVISTYSI